MYDVISGLGSQFAWKHDWLMRASCRCRMQIEQELLTHRVKSELGLLAECADAVAEGGE